jgi:hypothetical protein
VRIDCCRSLPVSNSASAANEGWGFRSTIIAGLGIRVTSQVAKRSCQRTVAPKILPKRSSNQI